MMENRLTRYLKKSVVAFTWPVIVIAAIASGCTEMTVGDDGPKISADLSDIDTAGAFASLQTKGDITSVREAVSCGDLAIDRLSGDERYHLYPFEARAEQQVSLTLSATDGGDMLLGVYHHELGYVTHNDDCGTSLDSCIEDFRLPVDGDYLVVVTTYSRRGNAGYELTLECQGSGRHGDVCSTSADCSAELGLLCAVPPGDGQGTCREIECGDDRAACVNAECQAYPDQPAGVGFCHRPDHCDDGSQVACRRMLPICEEGTILAYQDSCYNCVAPDTCEAPIEDTCAPRGCSGQVCADQPVVTICDFRPEYACLNQTECGRNSDDVCAWDLAIGSPAHACLTDLGRCVADSDCHAGDHCDGAAGWYGSCVPDESDCVVTGCYDQVCADAPIGPDLICAAFSPPYSMCSGAADCGRGDDGVCAWQVSEGDEAHACIVEHDRCWADADCGEDAHCERGDALSGACISDLPDPGRGAGELCNADLTCREGLRCQGIPSDGSDPNGVCWDISTQPDEGDACGADQPCNPGQFCDMGMCRAEWMRGTFSNNNATDIPDDDPQGVTSSVIVRGLATVPTTVVLHLVIRHTYRGDLRITLTDPNGQEVVVREPSGGSENDLVLHTQVGFSGDDSVNGRWTLNVSDLLAADVGIIESWSLDVASRWD